MNPSLPSPTYIPHKLFFCGVAGSGMSALAALLARRGHRVRGSDRALDSAAAAGPVAEGLAASGVEIFPQDGSGLGPGGVDALVVSSAVEPSVPDVRRAMELDLPILKRAELLSRVFAAGPAVAVGGTSGKTTVTAMVGHALRENGRNPTVVNGGIMLSSTADDPLGNVWPGRADLCVIEADESDRSIELYTPQVAAVTTLSLDHLPMAELTRLFYDFLERATRGAVLGTDGREARELHEANPNILTFALTDPAADLTATDLAPGRDGIAFRIREQALRLRVPGRHNVANALCAAGCCQLLDLAPPDALAALETFPGVERRLQVVGTTPDGCTVIDDFGHNPEKIAAGLQTLKEMGGRLVVFYQPHGFRPTQLLREGLVDTFVNHLGPQDMLLMPEIYYAGGTAERTISSGDLVRDVTARGVTAHFVPDRTAAEVIIREAAVPPATIVVMGARDPSLSTFARDLLATLRRDAGRSRPTP